MNKGMLVKLAIVVIIVLAIIVYYAAPQAKVLQQATSASTTAQSSTIITTISTTIPKIISTTTVHSSTVKPKVTITSPQNLSTVNGDVNISANVIDSLKIRSVQFYINGNLSHTVSSQPYYYIWSTTYLTGKEYLITVKAYDIENNTGNATILVDIGLVQHGK